ncbi:HAD family hydrolase [Lacticaseibacillus jixianensis]|uniref:HAD family hydrolase n=1 Tax=Lacticaseibacillus jixianensis TaxID=2486012 RepID=A0ABW4BCR4_9LACO|nr:HAD family hydrolase [Lacticaseibacillus jixianensis]
METRRIQLIASDLDHTLLDAKGRVPRATMSRLAALAALGIPFVPISGRDLPTMQALFPNQAWLVAANGAVIAHAGRPAQARLLAANQVQALLAAASAAAAVPVLCRLWQVEVLDGDAARVAELRQFFRVVRVVPRFTQLTDVTKVTLLVPPVRRRLVQATLEAKMGAAVQITAGEANALGITAAAVDKAAALTTLCHELAVPLSAVLAFGDAQNDAGMLRLAGVGMRMQDGDPALAAQTALIAPPNAEDGVGQVLGCLLEGHGRLAIKGG